MNSPSVPRCLALATLVKSCGSQPHDGFGGGVGLFISPSVGGCRWTQSRSWGPHCSYWCGMTPYSADRKRTGIFCLSVCLENGMKDVSIAIEWV